MPTVFRHGPYRFFFFSNEGNEPVHIHVESSEGYAKYWVRPVILVEAVGLRSHHLREIRTLIVDHADEIETNWNEFFHQD